MHQDMLQITLTLLQQILRLTAFGGLQYFRSLRREERDLPDCSLSSFLTWGHSYLASAKFFLPCEERRETFFRSFVSFKES